MLIMPALCRLRQEDCSGFQASQDAIVRSISERKGRRKGRREEGKEGGREKGAMKNPAPWLKSK